MNTSNVGYFGSWLLKEGRWSRAAAPERDGGTWLHIDIYDSDIAAIRYAPQRGGTGIAFVGVTPRVYFGDEAASAPTSVESEAAGVAAWIADYIGGNEIQLRLHAASYLADDSNPDDAGDEDPFVENKIARFLEAMGLQLPDRYWE